MLLRENRFSLGKDRKVTTVKEELPQQRSHERIPKMSPGSRKLLGGSGYQLLPYRKILPGGNKILKSNISSQQHHQQRRTMTYYHQLDDDSVVPVFDDCCEYDCEDDDEDDDEYECAVVGEEERIYSYVNSAKKSCVSSNSIEHPTVITNLIWLVEFSKFYNSSS